jgi:hypothetical protein
VREHFVINKFIVLCCLKVSIDEEDCSEVLVLCDSDIVVEGCVLIEEIVGVEDEA